MKIKFLFLIGVSLLVFSPLAFVGAADAPGGSGLPSAPGGGGPQAVAPSTGGSLTAFQLTNPLNVKSVCGLIESVLQALLVIGLPIAVLFLIFAGLKYVAALGNPGKISEANSNLLWTVVGIAIFLGAALIAQVVATTISQVASQSGVTGFQDVGSCD